MIATPYQVEDPNETAHKLGKILDGTSEEDVLKAIADRSSGFAYIARKVDLTDAQKISDLDLPGIALLPDRFNFRSPASRRWSITSGRHAA